MCGIFGFIGKQPNAAEIVLAGLKELEYRGYDSWGVVIKTDAGLAVEKEVGKIGSRTSSLPAATIGLGHTRWATHGAVTQANAHPHLSCANRVAVIHNGIVENYETLKSTLAGHHRFVSETDTEVVSHAIEQALDNVPFTQAVRQVFATLAGMNVIIALDSQSNQMVAGKKGSPLVLGINDESIYIASDASAILPHTRQLIFVEDGWLVEINQLNGKPLWKIREAQSGRVVKVKPQTIDWTILETDRGNFDHFMIKEIFEQPKVLRHLASQAEEKVGSLAKMIADSYGSFMIGCGTASYAALSGTYVFSRVARQHVNFVAGSEFFYQEQYLTPDSLVIAISQSGETMDIVESIQLAKKHRSKVVAVTNSLGSTLYRMADGSVMLDAGVEKAVCSTKAFTAMVGVLLLLAYRINNDLVLAKDLLQRAASSIETMLQPERLKQIKQVAEYIKGYEHMFMIGRGLSYAASLEAALKIKEVSYIHAEGFAGGELKHGVIALIETGTPCMVFAPNDETEAAIISNAMELKSRGGYIIGVGPQQHSVFDVWIQTDDVGDASIITNVVPAQLLGYYLAVAKGYDPDKPRNLAKSVTVK